MPTAAKHASLLTLDEAVEYARKHIHPSVDSTLLLGLERVGLLPAFNEPQKCYLLGDIDSLSPLLGALACGEFPHYAENDFFERNLPAQVCVGIDTWLPLGDTVSVRDRPDIYPALRHLAQLAARQDIDGQIAEEAQMLPWLGGTYVRARNSVAQAAKIQVVREAQIAPVGKADFARTAYYMGTKRDLGPFLVEALAGVLPPHGAVLDLMCGSGAASGAFSRVWPTYASDAQVFCQHLAVVQGGGYDSARATKCLARLLEVARSHEAELRKPLEALLLREAELCHSDSTPTLLEQFRDYIADVPTYPNDKGFGAWNPSAEVAARRDNLRRIPFCLFTAYFPTLFFGLRQAIEIDSLRFAIEQLENHDDRRWALGALIVATSVRATTYAAHFAQPRIRDVAELSLSQLRKILELWSGSVYHEFAVRFSRLALQSESAKYPVQIVSGPWNAALENFAQQVSAESVAVYLDAPYTREEYSRYYHVLETLVRYDYPLATGRGKVPSKARAERFASELFTRSQHTMEDNLVQIIRAVVKRGWICAWSYSNTGRARIPVVLERVAEEEACRIESFAAPHRHISQRGKKPKDVTEYVLLFLPRKS